MGSALYRAYLDEQQQQQSPTTPAPPTGGGSSLYEQYLAEQQQQQQPQAGTEAPSFGQKLAAVGRSFLPQAGESVVHTVGRDVGVLVQGAVKPLDVLGRALSAGEGYADATPTPSLKETALAVPQVAATALAGPAEGAIAERLGGGLAGKLAAGAAVGAGTGALYNPDDPVLGATIGAGLGTPLAALRKTHVPLRAAAPGVIEQTARDLAARPDGFTFDLRTGQHVTGGYAVGLGNDTGVHQVVASAMTPEAVQEVVAKNGKLWRDPAVMAGGWTDDAGNVHIEPSRIYASKDEAFLAGVEKGQQGIGDVGAYAKGADGFIDTSSPRAKAMYQLMKSYGLTYDQALAQVLEHEHPSEAAASAAGSQADAAGAAAVGGGTAAGAADAGAAGGSGGGAGEPPALGPGVAPGAGGGMGGDGRSLVPAGGPGAGSAGAEGAGLGGEPEADLNGFQHDPIDFQGWFNRAKIATSDPLASRVIDLQMHRAAEDLGPKQRISHAETLAAAKELAADPDALARGAKRMTREEFIASRLTIRRNALAISGLGRHLASGTARNPGEIEQAILALDRQSAAILARMAPARSEFGRALNSLKIMASQTTDPVYWMLKAQKMLPPGRVLTDGMRRDIRANLAAVDGAKNLFERQRALARLAKGIVQLKPSTPWEKATTVLRANLLSTPSSLIGAAVGHAGFAVTDAVDKNVAALFDRIVASVDHGVFGHQAIRTRMGGLADLVARGRGGIEGFHQANDMLLHGTASDILGVTDERLETNFLDPAEFTENMHHLGNLGAVNIGRLFLQKYTRVILRSYAYVPQIIRAQAIRASLEESGRILAAQQNLGGKLAQEFVREFVKNPDLLAVNKAIMDGDKAALVYHGGLAHLATATREAAGRAFGGPGEFAVNTVMPFTTVPSNIVGQAVAHNPLAVVGGVADLVRLFAKDIEGADKAALQLRAVDRLARGTTGSAAALLAGFLLAKAGRISGPSADTDALRQTAALAGRQPNSVRLGAHWYADAKMAPLSTMVELGALMYEAAQNSAMPVPDKAAFLVKGVGRSVEDAPFFEGVQKLQRTMEDPNRSVAKYLEEVAKGAVPTALAHAEIGVDPYQRAPEGFRETIASRVPGLANRVPVKLDQFGRPVTHGTGVLAALTPFRSTPDFTQSDPAVAALVANNVGVASLKPFPTETPEQFRTRVERFGPILHTALTQVVTSDGWQRIPLMAQQLAHTSPAFHGADPALVAQALRRQLLETVIARVHAASSASANVMRGVPREVQPLVAVPSGPSIH